MKAKLRPDIGPGGAAPRRPPPSLEARRVLLSSAPAAAPDSLATASASATEAVTGASPSAPQDDRSESPLERLDRNTVELLNGLRVAGTGIQVLFGFLLIVPFNARFPRLSAFERGVYLVTLICIVISTVLLIAPSIHHRLLFRRGEKQFLVEVGTRLMVLASVFLFAGLTGIMLLVSDFVIGIAGAVIVAGSIAALIAGLWFALPIRRRRAG